MSTVLGEPTLGRRTGLREVVDGLGGQAWVHVQRARLDVHENGDGVEVTEEIIHRSDHVAVPPICPRVGALLAARQD